MKSSISKKLTSLSERLVELDRLLSEPSVVNDMDSYRKITREHSDIGPVVALFSEYQKSEADIDAATEMGKDPEMREFAEDEIMFFSVGVAGSTGCFSLGRQPSINLVTPGETHKIPASGRASLSSSTHYKLLKNLSDYLIHKNS